MDKAHNHNSGHALRARLSSLLAILDKREDNSADQGKGARAINSSITLLEECIEALEAGSAEQE